MSLADASFVGNRLLCHARLAHLANPCDQLVAELRSAVLLISGPSATSALIAISDVVGVSAIFEMLRIDALAVIALMAAHFGPVVVPQKEGQAMRKDALLVSAQLSVSGDVQTSSPFPAAVVSNGGPGFDIALRERLRIHTTSLPYLNG